MKMANMDDYFDVVIVGTGAAGLYCALNLPARYRILLLTKQKADERLLPCAGRHLYAAWRGRLPPLF